MCSVSTRIVPLMFLIFYKKGSVFYFGQTHCKVWKTRANIKQIKFTIDWRIFCYSLTHKAKKQKKFLLHVVYE
jgi:hypothetical protein